MPFHCVSYDKILGHDSWSILAETCFYTHPAILKVEKTSEMRLYLILLLSKYLLISSVHGKVKPKPLSFQEFNSKTSDAWGEDDDDAIKVDPEEKKNAPSQPRVRTISGGDVRANIPTNAPKETKKLPEQLVKKEEHKTSRPSPLSLLSKELLSVLKSVFKHT